MALSTETKVGIFFLVGLVILGVITFKVEDWGALLKRKTSYKARFPHASGLVVGDTVAIAGLKVGEVKSLELIEDGVIMTLSIEARHRIRRDAVATIAWGGLLGNRYIDITRGTSSEFLGPGEEIRTGPSVEITAVLNKIDQATTQLQELLRTGEAGSKLTGLMDNLLKISEDITAQRGTVGKLIGSDEMYNKFDAIADDLKKASERMAKLVADNDRRLDSIISNVEAAAPEAKEAFAAIKRLGEHAESGKGLLPALLKDEKMYQDLKDSLSQLSKSLERVNEMTKSMREGGGLIARLTSDEQLANDFGDAVKSLREIAKRLETGDSTLARLTRDKDLYTDVKKLVDDARETLRSAKEQIPLGTFASVLLSAF